MNYLITGGAGFIGSNLVNRLVSQNNQVTVVDDLSMGKKENISQIEKICFIENSVTNYEFMEQLLRTEQFDYIFHLAAVASVADSIARPIDTHIINYDSVLYLLNFVNKYQKNMKRVVFSSSAAVYGDNKNSPKSEELAVNPLTQYAVDKYAAERTVINYYNLYGVPTSVVRFFNVYGPNQNPNSPYSGVISILADKFQKNKDGKNCQFTLFGTGKQTRDFIYVEDVIDALICIINSDCSLGEVYNVGTGIETSLNIIINSLADIYRIELPIEKKDARKGDIFCSVSDNKKLKSLGFVSHNTISEGLKKLVDSFY